MPLILNIDTSQSGIYISVCKAGKCVASRSDEGIGNQAQLLNGFVKEVMQESQIQFADLKAVSVLTGPGSYTGLRIGMASAKGFCMALDIPLIAIDNLYLLAYDYYQKNNSESQTLVPVFIPMANEIIFAKYNLQNKKLMHMADTTHTKEFNTIKINENELLIKNIKNNVIIDNLDFIDFELDKSIINQLAFECFENNQFADLILSEPNYVKEAYIQWAKK